MYEKPKSPPRNLSSNQSINQCPTHLLSSLRNEPGSDHIERMSGNRSRHARYTAAEKVKYRILWIRSEIQCKKGFIQRFKGGKLQQRKQHKLTTFQWFHHTIKITCFYVHKVPGRVRIQGKGSAQRWVLSRKINRANVEARERERLAPADWWITKNRFTITCDAIIIFHPTPSCLPFRTMPSIGQD